jgi:HAD superfamily hydrolase (TIGR01484 family)
MRFHALACDYDGTLAHDSRVSASTVAALERLRASGRRLILVTGRQIAELLEVFPETVLFDRVVGENGAVLYEPRTQRLTALAEAPPASFDERLRAEGVSPVARGHVIVATWRPHETAVLATIREMGLELQVIFNKDAVMVLPSGVNKASGLAYALAELRLSPHNAVAVGDAENDHALLAMCECAVAVANALPALKDRADWVTAGSRGDGVVELIDAMIGSDLAGLAVPLARHRIPLGTTLDGEEAAVMPYGETLLLAGTSGSGKSTFATAFVEALAARGYQFCIVDPEGDYADLRLAATLGDRRRVPSADEVLELLEPPERHLVVNLLGVSTADRPAFFARLLPRLQAMRAQTGRPHWIVIDEAHHLLPDAADNRDPTVPLDVDDVLFVTVHPEHVSRRALSAVRRVVAIGETPGATLAGFAQHLGLAPPKIEHGTVPAGEAILWTPSQGAWVHIRSILPQAEHQRHLRKYAEGELGPDKSFYFEGPGRRLHLRAQNLQLFVQTAYGVDDETWLHHLRSGDYSRWFREVIKDAGLSEAAAAVEAEWDLSAQESRDRIRALVEERYTAPA